MIKSKKILLPLVIAFLLTHYGCEKDYNGYEKEYVKNSNCDLEPNGGNCYAHIPKYYFNKEECKCKEFIWGGCEGTVPFDSFEECKACECNDTKIKELQS
jgi:hypothetical protein